MKLTNNLISMRVGIMTIIAASGMVIPPSSSEAETLRFQLNDEAKIGGSFQATSNHPYDAARGYGYLNHGGDEKVQLFAVKLEEGNHTVSLRFGSKTAETSTTVKAESRRLIFRDVVTKPGEFKTRNFTINIRRPEIRNGQKVKLKNREYGPPMCPSWDDRLTLEFNGSRPGVVAIEIEPNPEATTVFIAGDSTVTDQRNEPWAGWGQMLPAFFGPGVAISNHAESGLTLDSFEYQRRFEKILNMSKKGDYLFIQFGHNDQKDKRKDAGAFTIYKSKLESYVAAFRDKGGIPVLVTPMERRRWLNGMPQETLADFAEAVRQVGREMEIPVIDLHAMSLKLYGALGESNSKYLFVHFPAGSFFGQQKELADNTHHSTYGGYELSRCVVEGIRAELPGLAKDLREDAGTFDPIKPDTQERVALPPTPILGENDTPDGN